jgi:hypothetical protein
MQMLEYISKITWNSEFIHIERLFISDLRRISPLIILSNPRVTTPEEARASGKTIVCARIEVLITPLVDGVLTLSIQVFLIRYAKAKD